MSNVSNLALKRTLQLSLFFICGLALSAGAHAANKYRAFYYDAQYRLLQVEDVPDATLTNRTLVDLDDSVITIPMLTDKAIPLVFGDNLEMSKFAVIAVYYASDPDETATEKVRAFPEKVEYLGTVKERTLGICLARDDGEVCKLPAKCYCSGGSCCCH
jgi:hypothetical protein